MHDDDMTQRPHEERMNAEWSFLALFVAVLGASAGIAAPTHPAHQCHDPCLQAARDARAECVSSASGAFTDAFRNASTRAGSNWGSAATAPGRAPISSRARSS